MENKQEYFQKYYLANKDKYLQRSKKYYLIRKVNRVEKKDEFNKILNDLNEHLKNIKFTLNDILNNLNSFKDNIANDFKEFKNNFKFKENLNTEKYSEIKSAMVKEFNPVKIISSDKNKKISLKIGKSLFDSIVKKGLDFRLVFFASLDNYQKNNWILENISLPLDKNQIIRRDVTFDEQHRSIYDTISHINKFNYVNSLLLRYCEEILN